MSADVQKPGVIEQGTTQNQEERQSEQQKHFANLRKKLEALEQEKAQQDALLKQQQDMLNQMQARFQPQDDWDTLPDEELIDKAKFKKIIEKEREKLRKEAEQIARQTYQQIDSENYASKLKSQFPDYDQIVNEANAQKLQDQDPEFVAALSKIGDNYTRRELAYQKMKKLIQHEEKPKVKAQEVVEENRKTSGSYYAPAGQGPMSNPYAVEFDVRNPQARAAAYAKLKAAQKRG